MTNDKKLAREVRQLMRTDYKMFEAIRAVDNVEITEWEDERVRSFLTELSRQMEENNEGL